MEILDENNLSLPTNILNDSRLTPVGNGNHTGPSSSPPICKQPTSGEKWWASILLGFLFAIISCSASYLGTTKILSSLGGVKTINGTGPTLIGLIIHTIIFIIIVRIILW